MKNKKLVICILAVILLVIILVLIFNGKSKTLKCMYESSKDSYTSVIETKVSFDNSGDKMNAYNQVLTLTFNDDENIEDNLISLEELCLQLLVLYIVLHTFLFSYESFLLVKFQDQLIQE